MALSSTSNVKPSGVPITRKRHESQSSRGPLICGVQPGFTVDPCWRTGLARFGQIEPTTSFPPPTDVWSRRSPAQSESDLAVTSERYCFHGSGHTVPAWDRRYRPKRFTNSMSPCFGLDILLRSAPIMNVWPVEREVTCRRHQAPAPLQIIGSHFGLASQQPPSDFVVCRGCALSRIRGAASLSSSIQHHELPLLAVFRPDNCDLDIKDNFQTPFVRFGKTCGSVELGRGGVVRSGWPWLAVYCRLWSPTQSNPSCPLWEDLHSGTLPALAVCLWRTSAQFPFPFSEESLATASGDARARKSAHMRDRSTMASTKSSATLDGIGSLSLFIRP